MGNDKTAITEQIRQQANNPGRQDAVHSRLGSGNGDQLHDDLGTIEARMVSGADLDSACGQEGTAGKIECEVYSRIVGYLRPVSAWGKSKQREFADRKVYRIPEDDEHEG
jgi:ribonucleoside-triphosphate reductase